jgi:hypothetical protein
MIRITAFRIKHMAAGRLAVSIGHIPMLRPWLLRRFTASLRRLNDALQNTDLNGRYWIWGGVLLGWAREGAIMPHDCFDADFAVADSDFDRLVGAVPAIIGAGFRCDRRFVNSNGQVTELTFIRHGARFDFFRFFPVADGLRYYLYNITLKEIIEIEAFIPDQGTVAFSFIDRTWLKHKDHELELRSLYGSWQVPDPSWSYQSALSIRAKRVSPYSHFDWLDGAEGLTEGSCNHSVTN